MSIIRRQAAALRPPAWRGLVSACWPVLVAVVVGLVCYLAIGPLLGSFASKIMLIIGINVILAVSLTIVNGFTGQFSMGHAAFMAIGGYVAAAIVLYGSMRLFGTGEFQGGALSLTQGAESRGLIGRGDVLFLVATIAGGLFAAGAGYVVGLPSLRLRGDYLAIVTLGFGEIVRVLLQGTGDQLQPWKVAEVQSTPAWELALRLGGPQGFNLLPTYTTLFWVWMWVTITLLAAYRLKTSSSGRAFLSIREDEIASQAMGVDVTRYKVRAFVIASFFAGVAGAMYAMDIGAMNPLDGGFQRSFDIIIMVVLGGMGSVSGAVLAAVVLSILPEALRGLAQYRLIIYALLLVLMMIVRPQGLFGLREAWELGVLRRLLRGEDKS
ncbi:MAG: branched-chain amino acid ABC transporter permease [Planctomycetota bacterium]|nr:branched-chain amino acid ABC transporter permease [Planctomycetota bacterium]